MGNKNLLAERIALVCEKTGWSVDYTKQRMEDAKRLGISNYYYIVCKGWEYNDNLEDLVPIVEEKKELYRKKKARLEAEAERKRQRMEKICEATGWDAEYAEQRMEAARALGITNYYYIVCKGWEFNDNLEDLVPIVEEKKELYRKRKARIEAEAERKRQRIEQICGATGWDAEYAEQRMEAARALGITNYYYIVCKGWEFNDNLVELVPIADEKREKFRKRKIRELRKQRRIERICEATGWDAEYAEQCMADAKAAGISEYYYVVCKGWKYQSKLKMLSEIAKLTKKKKDAEKDKKENILKQAATDMGWSMEEASAHMDKLKEKGISNYYYGSCNAWFLTEAEQDELLDVIKLKGENRVNDKHFYAEIASQRSGMTMEETLEEMDKCSEWGLSPMRYTQKSFWALNEEEQIFAIRDIQFRKARSDKNTNTFVEEICKIMNWNRGQVLLEIEKDSTKYGASGVDYYQYRMWELTPEEKETIITWGLMQKLRIRETEYVVAHDLFDNKAKFNEIFADVINRRWFMLDENTTLEEFNEKIEGLPFIFSKPLGASGGDGVEKCKCNVSAADNEALFKRLQQGKTKIIEEAIIQHEKMSALSSTSVNTIRLVTLNHKGSCEVILAALRMGTGSAVDNLHSGGIAAEVNPKTGEVCTDAIDFNGVGHSIHPVTGAQINGFVVPHWDMVLETAERIFDRVPDARLIGWDFAITEDGIDIIEGNAGSGYDVIQMPHRLNNRTGLRPQAIDPYL